MDADKQKVYDFMLDHQLMVVTSLSDIGAPQSAVIGYGVTPDLQLIFGTSVTSRKAQNIANNASVSAVIGWEPQGTIQYEGTATSITKEQAEQYSPVYFETNPRARFFKDHPDERYFLVTPNWIRMTEIMTNPWTITEINLG